MSWHYRVGREKQADGSFYYTVREWYTPDKEYGEGWTKPITPGGSTKKELFEVLEMMIKDVKKYSVFTDTEDIAGLLQPGEGTES